VIVAQTSGLSRDIVSSAWMKRTSSIPTVLSACASHGSRGSRAVAAAAGGGDGHPLAAGQAAGVPAANAAFAIAQRVLEDEGQL
jgi:hypothetical protein